MPSKTNEAVHLAIVRGIDGWFDPARFARRSRSVNHLPSFFRDVATTEKATSLDDPNPRHLSPGNAHSDPDHLLVLTLILPLGVMGLRLGFMVSGVINEERLHPDADGINQAL